MDLVLEALAALGRATGITTSAVAYALVSATHILGIALLLGPILLVDLALVGRIATLDGAAIALLRRAAKTGLVVAMVSGVLLFSARPRDYAANPVVWMKLGVVALATANALAYQRRESRGMQSSGAAFNGGLSALLWLCVLLLGRWIAFT